MKNVSDSSLLLDLLNKAIARELQVSIQYMIQHAIGASQETKSSGKTSSAKQRQFVASHSPYWLPGPSLKKIAIAEMRHAEAIAERIVLLGEKPTTQPSAITLGKTAKEMLEIDREQERQAIELYGQIIDVAGKQHDVVTRKLFQKILSDEEKHHQSFTSLLGED